MAEKMDLGLSTDMGIPCFKTPIDKPNTNGPKPPDGGKVTTEFDYNKHIEKGGTYTGKPSSMQ